MITKAQETAIYTALGQASVCWIPKPKGIFNSDEAIKIGEDLIKQLNRLDKKRFIELHNPSITVCPECQEIACDDDCINKANR